MSSFTSVVTQTLRLLQVAVFALVAPLVFGDANRAAAAQDYEGPDPTGIICYANCDQEELDAAEQWYQPEELNADEQWHPGPVEGGFIVAACTETSNITSQCLNQEVSQAAYMLAQHAVGTYVWGEVEDAFTVYIPNVYPAFTTQRLLIDMANAAANQTLSIMQDDLNRVRAFEWPTEADHQLALAIIAEDERIVARWNQEARAEAEDGEAWRRLGVSHGLRRYEFRSGAYEQLRQIRSFGWLRQVRSVAQSRHH